MLRPITVILLLPEVSTVLDSPTIVILSIPLFTTLDDPNIVVFNPLIITLLPRIILPLSFTVLSLPMIILPLLKELFPRVILVSAISNILTLLPDCWP